MVRADDTYAQMPSLPSGTIGVCAWDMAGAAQVPVWERELCDVIEKAGYPARPWHYGGRGGGGLASLWIELRRILAEKAPLVSKVVAVERWARKAWLKHAYRKAETRLPPTNLLDVQVTAGRVDRTSSAQWVTTRDLVGLLGRFREVLDERGNYQLTLSGETRVGGRLTVFNLSDKDLRRSRVIRRLTQLADAAQLETGQVDVYGKDLRTWTWDKPKS